MFIQKLSHEISAQANESNFESMVDLTCKWEHQDFFYRNFSSQRIYSSNTTALTLTQPKILALKITAICGPLHYNEYAKEEEEEKKKK